MGLVLGMSLKFYANVSKGLKLEARKFLEQISLFVDVTEEKVLVGAGAFFPPSSMLKRINNNVAE